jgi:hypothetical protein
VINLLGQTAIPGFIEGHGHFTGVGENKINLDLMGTKSWDAIVHEVAMAVEKAKAWSVDRRPRLAPGKSGPRFRSRTSRVFRRTRRWTKSRRTIP